MPRTRGARRSTCVRSAPGPAAARTSSAGAAQSAVVGPPPTRGPRLFTYLSPAVLGALCGGAAEAAARHPGRSPIGSRVRVVAVGYAVVGMALGFLLEGTCAPVSLTLDVLVAYVIAAGAAWLWTAPPRAGR